MSSLGAIVVNGAVTAYSHFMTAYWRWWAIVTVTSFLVAEVWMLVAGRPQDTLSANVWRWEQFLPGQSVMHWTFVHFAFIAILVLLDIWLIGHFGWGLWH